MINSAPPKYRFRTAVCVVVLSVAGCQPSAAPIDPAAHRAEVEEWRAKRYAQLTEPFGPEGWLSLVGLYWLSEGPNSFGSAASNDLVFPPGSAAGHIGEFTLSQDIVSMVVRPGLGVLHGDRGILSLDMTPRTDGKWPSVDLGSLRWHVIKRGDRYGIRLRDRTGFVLTQFDGIEHFRVDPKWRFTARFDRYNPPKTIRVPNVLGTINDQLSPGAVVFKVGARTYRLDVTGNPADEAFFVSFGDSTNGFQTYGGGRYVWVDGPDERGRTVIDFNRSYNPPCVFTDYATCPLPPRQNRLALHVVAGEKSYHPKPPPPPAGASPTSSSPPAER